MTATKNANNKNGIKPNRNFQMGAIVDLNISKIHNGFRIEWLWLLFVSFTGSNRGHTPECRLKWSSEWNDSRMNCVTQSRSTATVNSNVDMGSSTQQTFQKQIANSQQTFKQKNPAISIGMHMLVIIQIEMCDSRISCLQLSFEICPWKSSANELVPFRWVSFPSKTHSECIPIDCKQQPKTHPFDVV